MMVALLSVATNKGDNNSKLQKYLSHQKISSFIALLHYNWLLA